MQNLHCLFPSTSWKNRSVSSPELASLVPAFLIRVVGLASTPRGELGLPWEPSDLWLRSKCSGEGELKWTCITFVKIYYIINLKIINTHLIGRLSSCRSYEWVLSPWALSWGSSGTTWSSCRHSAKIKVNMAAWCLNSCWWYYWWYKFMSMESRKGLHTTGIKLEGHL